MYKGFFSQNMKLIKIIIMSELEQYIFLCEFSFHQIRKSSDVSYYLRQYSDIIIIFQ